MSFVMLSVLACCIVTTINAQSSPSENLAVPISTAAPIKQSFDLKSASASADTFALNLLSASHELTGGNLSLALSPYTIWTLLSIINEGAQNNTQAQLETVLGIPTCSDCKEAFRTSYQSLTSYLTKSPIKDVTLDASNGIFIKEGVPLNASFQNISERVYGVKTIPTNFQDKNIAASTINEYLSKISRRQITDFIAASDIENTELFMTSALYFKGFWKVPFNKSATYNGTFHDEEGNPVKHVKMMYQTSPFPFSAILDRSAFAVELAYGDGDRISMIVILPRRGGKLVSVLRLLATTGISAILDVLARAEQLFLDEDVRVHLPKFRIQSDFVMNAVLDKMGVKDVFNSKSANLLGLSPKHLYLSSVIQRAVIDVDEEGTVASAAAGGGFVNKSPPPKFVANKPFAYLIVDKLTKTILFAGTVHNPEENE